MSSVVDFETALSWCINAMGRLDYEKRPIKLTVALKEAPELYACNRFSVSALCADGVLRYANPVPVIDSEDSHPWLKRFLEVGSRERTRY